jgi:hypothetical protein
MNTNDNVNHVPPYIPNDNTYYPSITTPNVYPAPSNIPAPPAVCPGCGRCNHCGRPAPSEFTISYGNTQSQS